ncbi:MAG: LamG-like jellyroll fold domain-containing protein, partial [Chthoniobacteraceae bacterium]
MIKSLPTLLSVLAASFSIALCAQLRADVVLDLDAAGLSGEISRTPDKAAVGQWNANVPLRVEAVQSRRAFVLDGTQQLISEFALPADFEKKPFTVEGWVLNQTIEKAETVVAFAPVKGGPGTEFSFSSGPSAGAFRSGFKATTPFASLPSANVWHHLAWTYGGGADATLRVYVDGELDVERALKFTMAPQAKVHVGASGEVDNKGPKKGFSGAVAR